MRRVHESVAETKTCKWYDGLGLLRIKVNIHGRRGWPDQEFFIPGGKPFLIEFKADGEDPRALQAYTINCLREDGYDVEVHTTAEGAIAAIKSRLKSAGWKPGTKRRATLDAGTVPGGGRRVPA